jgi:phosphoglycerate dehydrogenase-like enzyme
MLGIPLPLILITHTLPKDWLLKLEGHCNSISGPSDATQLYPSLIELLPEAEGLLSLLTIPVTKNILDQAPKLRVVSNMAAGVDNINIDACTKRMIPVGNTPGVLTESTADLTMALLLSIARKIPIASSDAYQGRWKTWSPAGWLGLELNGKTLGIIGMGKIGQAVAKRAIGFGMNILFTDPVAKHYPNAYQVTLENLLRQSDIISLHAPLTPETRGMINRSAFLLMKPTALLINAARGQLVETDDLVEALQGNRISAVALDVTDPEPLPQSHQLYQFSNCLIVPHIGSATEQTRKSMAELACQNLLAGLRGERLLHCANPEVYDQIK